MKKIVAVFLALLFMANAGHVMFVRAEEAGSNEHRVMEDPIDEESPEPPEEPEEPGEDEPSDPSNENPYDSEPGETGNCEEGHTWDEGEELLAPNCTEPGVMLFTCLVCGETEDREILALGHDFELIDEIPATCTEPGTALYGCKVCRETKEREIPPLGHDPELVEEVPANCTEDGTASHLRCTRCERCFSVEAYDENGEFVEIAAEDLVIPAMGHTFADGVCAICGEEDPDYIPPAPFNDVEGNEYYAVPVAWAVKNEITNGTGETTFSPHAVCTRGQVVTFLWRASGCPEPALESCAFLDVDRNSYYYKAMLWAIETGITNGTTETSFAPERPCCRGEVVTFLYRAAGISDVSIRKPYRDVDIGDFFCEPVIWATEHGVTTGTSDVTFSPNDRCTRAQIVTFLYRTQNPVANDTACRHNYIAGEKQDATCTVGGSIAYRCEACGDAYTATIPALGHAYVDTVVAPRTDREGYTEHTCSRCGSTYRNSHTPKKPIQPATEEDAIRICEIVNAYYAEQGVLLEGCPYNAGLWFTEDRYLFPETLTQWKGETWLYTNDDQRIDKIIDMMCEGAVEYYTGFYYETFGWGSKLACGYYDDRERQDCFQIVIYLGN